MRIILLRHGETYWNRKKKMQGRTDIPLNENGREQAIQAGHHLPCIEYCLTSPLFRARETAQLAIDNCKVPVVDEPLLLEQGYGLCEGASQRIGFNFPVHPLYNYKHHPERYQPPIGGESFSELYHRAEILIDKALFPLEGEYKSVLLSAHGAILCALTNVIEDIPISQFWSSLLPNCGTRELSLQNGVLIVKK